MSGPEEGGSGARHRASTLDGNSSEGAAGAPGREQRPHRLSAEDLRGTLSTSRSNDSSLAFVQRETEGGTRTVRAPSGDGWFRRRTQSETPAPPRRRAQSDYVNTARFEQLSKTGTSSPRGRRGSSWLSRSRTASGRFDDDGGSARSVRRRNSSVHAVDLGVLETMEAIVSTPEGAAPAVEPTKPRAESTEELEAESCLICMGRFTKKRPSILIPCSKKCNLAPVHAKCIFEWKEQKRGAGTCPLCRSELGEINYQPPDILQLSSLVMYNFRHEFVMSPVPKAAGMIRCYIRARNGMFGSPVRYEMYVQAPTTLRYPLGVLPTAVGPEKGDHLLMTAKKSLNKWGGSVIDVSLDRHGKDFARAGHNYLGTVHGNTAGMEFTMHAPFRSNVNGSNAGGQRELVGVAYTQNRMGSHSGPRRMSVALPEVKEVSRRSQGASGHLMLSPGASSVGEVELGEHASLDEEDDEDYDSEEEDVAEAGKKFATETYRPKNKSEHMVSCLRKGRQAVGAAGLVFGQNKEPYWLNSIGAFSLDFQGRVTLPSNKNFQLELDTMPETIVMQFGKVVAADSFSPTAVYTIDLQWPISPVQAFGIALSSMDRKFLVA